MQKYGPPDSKTTDIDDNADPFQQAYRHRQMSQRQADGVDECESARAGVSTSAGCRTTGILSNSIHGSASVRPAHISPPSTRARRNSTGTLYIDTTMSAQDNRATIHCVCVVIRLHMLEAERLGIEADPEFDVFRDTSSRWSRQSDEHNARGVGSGNVSDNIGRESGVGDKRGHRGVGRSGSNMCLSAIDTQSTLVPLLTTIRAFFEEVFSKSQLEGECIIMALVYVERLMKVRHARYMVGPSW